MYIYKPYIICCDFENRHILIFILNINMHFIQVRILHIYFKRGLISRVKCDKKRSLLFCSVLIQVFQKYVEIIIVNK